MVKKKQYYQPFILYRGRNSDLWLLRWIDPIFDPIFSKRTPDFKHTTIVAEEPFIFRGDQESYDRKKQKFPITEKDAICGWKLSFPEERMGPKAVRESQACSALESVVMSLPGFKKAFYGIDPRIDEGPAGIGLTAANYDASALEGIKALMAAYPSVTPIPKKELYLKLGR